MSEVKICTECNQACEGEWIDVGIGPNEFWGVWQNHRDERFLSSCCEAPMIDEHGADVEDDDRDRAEAEADAKLDEMRERYMEEQADLDCLTYPEKIK